MKFSEEIKRLRKEHHYTQDELAKKLHITRQAVSNWENEKIFLILKLSLQSLKSSTFLLMN